MELQAPPVPWRCLNITKVTQRAALAHTAQAQAAYAEPTTKSNGFVAEVTTPSPMRLRLGAVAYK